MGYIFVIILRKLNLQQRKIKVEIDSIQYLKKTQFKGIFLVKTHLELLSQFNQGTVVKTLMVSTEKNIF